MEADESQGPLLPQEARLRNLTYSAPLYVDIKKTTMLADPNHPLNEGVVNINDMHLEQEGDDEVMEKVFIGRVPIMVRSTFCALSSTSSKDIYSLGECPFDAGGYFVINGSEKVLIAQERMATNQVYVFAKAPPSQYSYTAEIRSALEKGGQKASTLYVKMLARSSEKGVRSCCFFCSEISL